MSSENVDPRAGLDVDIRDIRPPPLVRQRAVGRDQLLPGAAPFTPTEPVVNGTPLVPSFFGQYMQQEFVYDDFEYEEIVYGDTSDEEEDDDEGHANEGIPPAA